MGTVVAFRPNRPCEPEMLAADAWTVLEHIATIGAVVVEVVGGPDPERGPLAARLRSVEARERFVARGECEPGQMEALARNVTIAAFAAAAALRYAADMAGDPSNDLPTPPTAA